MADTNTEPNKKQASGNGADKRRAAAKPRRTRFIFTLLGLLLVALAGWMAWYAYRERRLPDWLDPNEQQRAARQAKTDLVVARNWLEVSLEELQKRIKGPPPDSNEDVTALVAESQRNVGFVPPPPVNTEKRKQNDAAPDGRAESNGNAAVPPKPPAAAPSPLDPARQEYTRGESFYAKTDPSGSFETIQKHLHLAEPCFVRCLELLDRVTKAPAIVTDVEKLEQSAAKRLYDCRKRMTLKR
jgi:hypothetical protein